MIIQQKSVIWKFECKNHTLILLVFAMFFFCTSIQVLSQELPEAAPQEFRSNTIHGGLGYGGLIITATINYERVLTQHFDKFITATFAKVGYGTFGGYYGTGQYAFVQYGILTGKKAHHFEASAGPNFYLKGEDLNLPIAFGFGYRYQKPGRPFMLRTGIAFPESIHFGMGLSS
jgi:hypothetical protein